MSFRLKEGRLIIGLPSPTNYTSIGSMHAFTDYSGLTSATISNSMTSIGRLSFSDCYGPTSVTIGNSVTKLVDAAYYTRRQFLRHQPHFYHSTTYTTKEPI